MPEFSDFLAWRPGMTRRTGMVHVYPYKPAQARHWHSATACRRVNNFRRRTPARTERSQLLWTLPGQNRKKMLHFLMAAWIFTMCLNVHNPPEFLQCAWIFTIHLNFYNPPEFSQSAWVFTCVWIFTIRLNFYNVPAFSQSAWIFTMCLNFHNPLNFDNPPEFSQLAWIFTMCLNFHNPPEFVQCLVQIIQIFFIDPVQLAAKQGKMEKEGETLEGQWKGANLYT
jgi:hypothetical protein